VPNAQENCRSKFENPTRLSLPNIGFADAHGLGVLLGAQLGRRGGEKCGADYRQQALAELFWLKSLHSPLTWRRCEPTSRVWRTVSPVTANQANAVEGIITMGVHLIEAKTDLGHGEFQDMVKTDLGSSQERPCHSGFAARHRIGHRSGLLWRAIGEDGKPLAGAARTSFMKSCCEASALDKDGKPLAGTAKASYVENCESAFSAPEERG
jgi:hypothetical protein